MNPQPQGTTSFEGSSQSIRRLLLWLAIVCVISAMFWLVAALSIAGAEKGGAVRGNLAILASLVPTLWVLLSFRRWLERDNFAGSLLLDASAEQGIDRDRLASGILCSVLVIVGVTVVVWVCGDDPRDEASVAIGHFVPTGRDCANA
jgi:hypothetical protein